MIAVQLVLIATAMGLLVLSLLFNRTGRRVARRAIEEPGDLDRRDRLVFWLDDYLPGESSRELLWPEVAK